MKTLPMTVRQVSTFLDRLEGKDGCDFRERIPGKADSLTWKCGAGQDQSKAQRILKAMRFTPSQIKTILALCRSWGGYCDCEILFNASDQLTQMARTPRPPRKRPQCGLNGATHLKRDGNA